MNKPLSVAMAETRKTIIDTLSNSGLPGCILLPIMKELTQSIADIADKQLASDMAVWEKEKNDGEKEVR